MDFVCLNLKHFRCFGPHLNSFAYRFLVFVIIILVLRAVYLPVFSGLNFTEDSTIRQSIIPTEKKSKFLEVPQIIWGLNNQKIGFARAVLTARMLNRTLLMPSLSASLFYKEVNLLKPISFDKVFDFQKFNSLCKGFVELGRYSQVLNSSDVFELKKGSGRRWTVEKDLGQLRKFSEHPYDGYETIRVVGKNPFLWHDHWPVRDYAKAFECLELVEEISRDADDVVSKIRSIGSARYVAVHMRIEKDWMIHCKNMEQRSNITEICSSKAEIMQRVGNIVGIETPITVYLAVADDLLEDSSISVGWRDGLVAIEKKKLGFLDVYKKYPYLIQSAIDYEVCLRSDVFVGNSFSTFSGLVVLDRTRKMGRMQGVENWCGLDGRWPSYAYNLRDDRFNGPRPWAANVSDLSLKAISYGSNRISC